MNRILISIFVGLVIILGCVGYSKVSASTNQNQTARKIVVFTKSVNSADQEAILTKNGVSKIKQLPSIHATVVTVPSSDVSEKLKHNPGVIRVDDDIIINIDGKTTPPVSQTIPWGVSDIGANQVWNITTGDPIKVGIIDTGIDLKHPDLLANIKGGYNAIDPRRSANDDNGHGTHVAGIVAAVNNGFGVVGVGPAIDLYAIKVLDSRGTGYLSDIIEGLDWAVSHGIQVVNMSLGTSTYNASFEDAIKRTAVAGIVEIVAAGNSGPANNTVEYPAKFSDVIAVSAVDSSNVIASFSSRGPEVALAAPGVNVYSTYKGSTYKTLSGTSMAAPHVTGSAALVLTTPVGLYDSNSNGHWDPSEVKAKLQATAHDLGLVGFDQLYGAGLVNVPAAIR